MCARGRAAGPGPAASEFPAVKPACPAFPAVKMEKEKAKDGTELETLVIGLTDIFFNPMIVVYEKKLVRKDGFTVTPAYWNQWPEEDTIPYWKVQR